MKKFFIIATAAALCIPMSGCNKDNNSQWTATVIKIKSIEDVSSGTTTLTEYEWTEDGAPAGETQTVDGTLVYEDSGYSYSGMTATYTRTAYLGNGNVSDRQKRVAEYTSGWYSVKSLSVFELDATGTPGPIPLERTERSFDDYGRITGYEYKLMGTLQLKEDGYIYSSDIVSYNTWDYSTDPATQTITTTTYTSGYKDYTVVTTPSGEQIEYTLFTYNAGPTYTGYKKYRKISGEDVLVEAQTGHSMSSDYKTESFDTILYEDDGKTQKSKVSTTRTYYVSTIVLSNE